MTRDMRSEQDQRSSSMEETTEKDTYLPSADRGAAAWKFLIGCYFAEGLIWGLALSFGVFQAYYEDGPFQDNKGLPVIGTCATAIAYFGLPVVSPFARRYPQRQIHLIWVGWSICILSLVASSFATNVWHLIVLQGICYGSGWAICYTPQMIMLNQWFVERRGAAYGILFGSSGLAAVVFPFALEPSLARFGFRTTLRLAAVLIALVSGPPMLLLRPRETNTPPSRLRQTHINQPRINPALRSTPFFFFTAAIFLQGIGWLMPRFFLPSFSYALSLSSTQADSLLAMFGLAQVVGQLTLGSASDKINIHILTTLSTSISAASVLLLWGPAKTFETLLMFTIFNGTLGGGYSVLWSRIALYCTQDEGTVISIYSVFSTTRALSTLLAGPITAFLVSGNVRVEEYGLGRYANLSIFVGLTMAMSAATCVGSLFKGEVDRIKFSEKSQAVQDEEMILLNTHLGERIRNAAFELESNDSDADHDDD